MDMTRVGRPRAGTTAALAGAAIVALAGCGGDSGGGSGNPDSQQGSAGANTSPQGGQNSGPSSSKSDPSSATEQTRTALRAVSTAEEAVQDGQVFDLESDTDDGKKIWEAKVAGPQGSQYELDISENGEKVLNRHKSKSPDDDVDKLQSAQVSLPDAVDTAAERASGKGKLSSLEIDTYHGSGVVWQINFGGDDGTTVVVDAKNGKVLDVGEDAG